MIYVFIGTKAQLIKMAPVMRELQQRSVDYTFIFSGQHKATISDLLSIFNIKEPDITLYDGNDIKSIGQFLPWMYKVLTNSGFKSLKTHTKSVVLNHGDTLSTLLGAIFAKYNAYDCAHIESGLRSFNIFHPFPEELTRLIVFRLTNLFFCQDEFAIKNLSHLTGVKINTHGNTLIDSFRLAQKHITQLKTKIPASHYAVISIHRFENIRTKKAIKRILDIVNLAGQHTKCYFIGHKPTLHRMNKFELTKTLNKNIEIIDRMDYFNFIKLVNYSEFVITDGGSNQEECAYMGKPCLLLRNKTERHEGLGENAVLSKYNHNSIQNFLDNYETLKREKTPISATPSSSIVDELIKLGYHN